MVDPPGHERLDALDLAALHGAQLADLDDPLAAQILGAVLGAQVGDLVGEPASSMRDGGAAVLLPTPCGAFEDQAVVGLAAGLGTRGRRPKSASAATFSTYALGLSVGVSVTPR